jgi:hypothetical protein
VSFLFLPFFSAVYKSGLGMAREHERRACPNPDVKHLYSPPYAATPP